MTIQDRVRGWLGIYPNTMSQISRDLFMVTEQAKRIESKLDALTKQPTVVASPKVNFRPAVPTDFEGLSLQALHDLEKEAN